MRILKAVRHLTTFPDIQVIPITKVFLAAISLPVISITVLSSGIPCDEINDKESKSSLHILADGLIVTNQMSTIY